MAHRTILTERHRNVLFALPTDEPSLLKHYTLADDDLEYIRERRRPENKLGFALQLCALRFPGRTLAPGELISEEILAFIGAQIGISEDALATYAKRRQTRHQHMDALRAIYGFKSFSGRGARELKTWLIDRAVDARSSEGLVRNFVEECRRTQIILPAISTIERLCANALVHAERQIDTTITDRLDSAARERLDTLLAEMVKGQLSRFVWLRQFQISNNSADANRLLDRLEFLQKVNISRAILEGIPAHRISRLRRHGERYFIDDLRDMISERRYAIMVVCIVEWQTAIADCIVETHDRIVGKTWRDAKRICEAKIADEKTVTHSTLRSFKDIGTTLIEAHNDEQPLEKAIAWAELEQLVATVTKLTDTMAADPLAHVSNGYNRFRRYAPRMLRALDIQAAQACKSLLTAIDLIRSDQQPALLPTNFLRRASKWYRHIKTGDHRIWEVAVMFHIREAFRSGDIWLAHSRQFSDLKETLVPAAAVPATLRLAVPYTPDEWIASRRKLMQENLHSLAKAVRSGSLPHGSVKDGKLIVERLQASVPEGADDLVLDLYQRLPEVRITDILLEVDVDLSFTEAFTHLRTGAPCKDKIGLLNVLLSEGINLGLSKMAEASNTHNFWQLSRLSRWHIESEAINRALAIVIDGQHNLPMADIWGLGETASSDGQFFPTTRQGEAMNLINAKYGNTPGLKAYTHVSDQFAPFATQTIPATVNEAPYILDGLLMNETGKQIKEQYADTGGFTDHVFAMTALLGFRFVPRIRDLPSKRLYLFDTAKTPKELQGLIGGKIREKLIRDNWPDILRLAATAASGTVPPSQLLRKLASYPRQHELAVTLREIGRVERTLFMMQWLLDTNMQRRAQIGLNKGEAHHALKNALRIGRQSEIRDRTTESQHYRLAGLNLLAAIIIYWNTKHLGIAVTKRQKSGHPIPDELLCHVSPLGWAHILLTGEYRWPKNA